MHPARHAISAIWIAAASAAANPERDAAWDRLLAERDSPQEFAKAMDQATEAGISPQQLLEARFLFHVDRGEDGSVAALAPEFVKRRDSFKPADSGIFATREDWLAVVEYAQALAALQREDTAGFKKHITEAFWLSPGQGAAFAPHIERLRLTEAIKDIRIDLTIRLADLHDNELVALTRDNGESVATLLHFWSPWSRECEAMLPEFIATCAALSRHNIAVASILPEQDPAAIADAREALAPLGADPPGGWLVDRPVEPLAAALRVTSLPAFILLDRDGGVVFHGSPDDPEFWRQLQTVAPGLARPEPPPSD